MLARGGGSIETTHETDDEDDESFLDDELAATEGEEGALEPGGGDDDANGNQDDVAPENSEESPASEKTNEGASEILDEDEHSSANVDRMDYADAYDEDVEGGEEEDSGEKSTESDDNATTSQGESTVESTSLANVTGIESSGETPQKIPLVSEITPAMKDILIKKLKYRPKEVKHMRPEIAAVVVAKELQRPQEGLPPQWYVAGAPKRSSLGSAKSILLSLLAVAVAVVGGTALSGGTDFVWDATGRSNSGSAVPAPPPATTPYEAPPVPEPSIPAEPEPEPKPEELLAAASSSAATAETVEHEHSLRPGERPPTEPIDETVLDRFLTKMEKGLGRLFGR